MTHKPWVAAIFNLLVPGSGYLYNGKRLFLGGALTIFYLLSYYIGLSQSAPTSDAPITIVNIVLLISFFAANIAFSWDAYQESYTLKHPTT